MVDTHLSSVPLIHGDREQCCIGGEKLLCGGFELGEVRQWFVRTRKFGVLLDRTNGSHTQCTIRTATLWNQLTFVGALSRV